MKLQSNTISMKMNIGTSSPNKRDVKLNEKIVSYNGQIDYEKNVINKPKLNGKEIVGDMVEDDPNVKPIELTDLSNMFNSIFN